MFFSFTRFLRHCCITFFLLFFSFSNFRQIFEFLSAMKTEFNVSLVNYNSVLKTLTFPFKAKNRFAIIIITLRNNTFHKDGHFWFQFKFTIKMKMYNSKAKKNRMYVSDYIMICNQFLFNTKNSRILLRSVAFWLQFTYVYLFDSFAKLKYGVHTHIINIFLSFSHLRRIFLGFATFTIRIFR